MRSGCIDFGFGVLALAGAIGAVGLVQAPAMSRGAVVDNFSGYSAGVPLNNNAAWANSADVWIVGLHNGVNDSPGVYWSGGGYEAAQYATALTLPGGGQTLSDSADFNFMASTYAAQGYGVLSVGFMYTPYPSNNYLFATVAVANTASNEGLLLSVFSNTAYMGNAGWLAYKIPAAGVNSDWFNLGLSVTETGSGNYNVAASLSDLSGSGTTSPTLLESFSAPVESAADLGISGGSGFYAGFKYENAANEQLQGLNVDNFSLSQPATSLPEPPEGMVAMVGFSLAALVLRRRSASSRFCRRLKNELWTNH